MIRIRNNDGLLMTTDQFFDDVVHRHWHFVHLSSPTFKRNFPSQMPSKGLPIIREWCDTYDSSFRYYSHGAHFYFENENDATMFALRWA